MLLDRMKGWNVDVMEQTVNICNKHGYDISVSVTTIWLNDIALATKNIHYIDKTVSWQS